MVVDNTMIYHCEKFQLQIRNILIYAKKRNLARFQIIQIAHCSPSQLCGFSLFCSEQNTRNFLLQIFTVIDQCIIYDHDFFQNFSIKKIANSIFFWKTGLHVARPPFRLSAFKSCSKLSLYKSPAKKSLYNSDQVYTTKYKHLLQYQITKSIIKYVFTIFRTNYDCVTCSHRNSGYATRFP